MRPTFPPPRRSLPRISFLGDAFTVGAGDETALGWVGRVVQAAWQRHHDVTISNLGTRGASTRVLLRRWRQECEARLPRGVHGRLVFMFGGNDAKEVVGTGLEVPLEESVADARAIMAAAAAWLPTLWLSLMPMSETRPSPRLLPETPAYRCDRQRQAAYTRRYAAVARELGVPFLDLHTPLLHDPAWQPLTQAGDGSNPHAEGYAKIAALWRCAQTLQWAGEQATQIPNQALGMM